MDGRTRFRDVQVYIELEKHPSERFRFVAYDEKVMNVKKYYEESRRDHERIGLIFLTETGHPDERLLGILTSWLIIGN